MSYKQVPHDPKCYEVRLYMIIFFLKQLLHARSSRISLLAAGLAIALPMAACIALAQEPAATSTKTTLAVSSVRVVLMWSLRTALMATVARRNLFSILIPAE